MSFSQDQVYKKRILVCFFRGMDGKLIVTTVDEQGQALLTVNGEDITDKITSYLTAGEDLQGEYWGTVFLLPTSLLECALGCLLTVGQQLEDNFIRDGKSSAMHSKRRGNW